MFFTLGLAHASERDIPLTITPPRTTAVDQRSESALVGEVIQRGNIFICIPLDHVNKQQIIVGHGNRAQSRAREHVGYFTKGYATCSFSTELFIIFV